MHLKGTNKCIWKEQQQLCSNVIDSFYQLWNLSQLQFSVAKATCDSKFSIGVIQSTAAVWGLFFWLHIFVGGLKKKGGREFCRRCKVSFCHCKTAPCFVQKQVFCCKVHVLNGKCSAPVAGNKQFTTRKSCNLFCNCLATVALAATAYISTLVIKQNQIMNQPDPRLLCLGHLSERRRCLGALLSMSRQTEGKLWQRKEFYSGD